MSDKTMENRRYKVLFIEDDQIDQMAFKRLVKNDNLPYDYTVATSVSEAKSRLDSESFDIIIVDYLLGDGTAFDILDSVNDIPAIFATGAGDEEIAVKAMKAGACDYLIKDIERNYLKALPITVEYAVRHSELSRTMDRKQKNLEAIFDAVPVGMLLVDKNMTVRRANDAIRRTASRRYSQIINQQVGAALGCVNNAECGKGPNCLTCLLHKTIESVLTSGESVHNVELQFTFEVNGKEVTPWLCISAEPVMIDGARFAVIAVNDITAHKKAEEKLRETMEMKSQFISTVSHELRTPLGCIKEGIAVVLDGMAGEINEKQRNFLDIAKRNIDRLALLINDILDFQRLETKKAALDMQANNIVELVEEVHKTMASSANKKCVDFVLQFEDDLPQARFDRNKIIQVLTNLVSNAIKFTPEHGRVWIRVHHRQEDLVIAVSDTGMGIPKDSLPKIFERFYRVRRPGKEIQGTGLGLAIVSRIVTMHNGRIEVESEVDKGTTFTVFLPLAAEPAPQLPTAETDQILENKLVNN